MTTRAYIRTDPGLFMRKAVEQRYPISAFATYQAVLCLAEEQPERGRFRSERLLRLLLDDPTDAVHLGWGKHVKYLLSHGDLVRQPDGSLYVDGWDEWQEGDVTVNERMARLRDRRRNAGKRNHVTPPVTAMVTVPIVTIPSEPLAAAEAVAVSRGGGVSLGVLPRWGTSRDDAPDADVHPREAS
jgi:hypothetical protein